MPINQCDPLDLDSMLGQSVPEDHSEHDVQKTLDRDAIEKKCLYDGNIDHYNFASDDPKGAAENL